MTAPTNPDFVGAQFELRAAIYETFSQAFLSEAESVQIAALGEVVSFCEELARLGDSPALEAAAARMRSRLAETPDEDELARAYARVFLVGHGAVAPYQSVFDSLDGLAMQAARDECLAFYAGFGLACDEGAAEPEDHVGVQLAFLAWLNRPSDAFSRSDLLKAQAEFIDRHLRGWVPRLAAAISETDPLGWYAELAGLLGEFLEADRRHWVEALIESEASAPISS